MWFVVEACGIVCVIFTYLTVFTVQFAFVRIGVWEDLLQGDYWAMGHLAVFSYNVFMIIASHLKCMTSEPGVLPKDYEELDPQKLPPELSLALAQIHNTLLNDDEEEDNNETNQSTQDTLNSASSEGQSKHHKLY